MTTINVDTNLKEQAILNRAYDDDSRSIKVSSLNALVSVPFDSIYETEPTTSTEVYTYKKDGATVATVTVTYADSTKERFVSAVLS